MGGCHRNAEGDEDRAVLSPVVGEGSLAEVGQTWTQSFSSVHASGSLSEPILEPLLHGLFFPLQCFISSVS